MVQRRPVARAAGAPTSADPPDAAGLAALLGDAFPAWEVLRARLGEACAPSSEVWRYAAGSGWSLRVRRGERVIVYLAPRDGHVLASFALGGRAVVAAREAGLSDRVLDVLATARRYAEGTAVRLEVRGLDDVADVLVLAAAKLAH